MYIFVDCDRELNSFHNFLLASLFISVLGLIGIFILLLLFSPHAVRPIVESYEKQKQFITEAHKGKITAKCPNRQVIQFLLTFPMKNK